MPRTVIQSLDSSANAPSTPSRIKILRHHGFIEEETRRHRLWKAGDVVTNPDEIDLLISRGAEIENLG